MAVPDWRIHTPDLIAYPLLPGEPGLTIAADGTPTWHVDAESAIFTDSLGELLAQLHTIDPGEVADTGVDILTPAQVRQSIRDDIARVSSAFEVSADLLNRWTSWLADDRYWPHASTLTHGELYPAHLLLTGETVVGVLDWTTAAVGDPARDFVFHRESVSRQAFDATVRRYVLAPGERLPAAGRGVVRTGRAHQGATGYPLRIAIRFQEFITTASQLTAEICSCVSALVSGSARSGTLSRVTSSARARAARSASEKYCDSHQAARTASRSPVSPRATASRVCIRRQNAHPLIWDTRILTSSTSLGSRPADVAASSAIAFRAIICW